MSRSSADAGFTLIEILVIVAILSLIPALASPLLRRPPAPARLKADVTRLAAALRVTRAAALAQNREMDFVVRPGPRTYASPAIPVSSLDPAIDVGIIPAGAGRVIPPGTIRFFPSGQSTGGELRLRLDHAEARLQVIWATGHVVVHP
ncbi:prepilin-type N-terminal cleavage/methylation domain-containing protein [Microvirga sp. BT689]|uniref:GspH/FimT family pseudopilin n=1 Tax=Microvirga arvi TaxID=2778731 RepID=UPI00194F8E1F|nr:GspH/FimT family pseudopilin [Microvirga arvi]MBM6582471.1 prepilin-type N-terminal cleavage/methylation domain-containing protein [Microvirga arvi]